MKKALRFILYLSTTFLQGNILAQTIPNSGMEDWITIPSTVSLERPQEWWGLDQVLYNMHPLAELAGYSYVVRRQINKSGDRCEEDWAARIITRDYEGDLGLVPGIMSNAKISIDSATALAVLGGTEIEDFSTLISFSGGAAIEGKKVDSITVCVLAPVYNTDAAAIFIMAMQNDTMEGADSLVQIGAGMQIIYPDSNTQHINVPMVYYDTDRTVTDTLRIVFVSSVTTDTTMGITDENRIFVDEVNAFLSETPMSITARAKYNSGFNIFPVPAQDILSVKNNSNVPNCQLQLYNSTGKLMISKKMNNAIESFSIASLPDGLYFAKILDANAWVVYTEKVLIHK